MARLVLAVVAVAASILVVICTVSLPRRQLARRVAHETRVVASLGELDDDTFNNNDVSGLTSEAEVIDTFQLAESPPSDEQWLQQTLQLLDQFTDETKGASPTGASEEAPSSDDSWLKELEMLDDTEFSSSS